MFMISRVWFFFVLFIKLVFVVVAVFVFSIVAISSCYKATGLYHVFIFLVEHMLTN